jgi:hypothetical protein
MSETLVNKVGRVLSEKYKCVLWQQMPGYLKGQRVEIWRGFLHAERTVGTVVVAGNGVVIRQGFDAYATVELMHKHNIEVFEAYNNGAKL